MSLFPDCVVLGIGIRLTFRVTVLTDRYFSSMKGWMIKVIIGTSRRISSVSEALMLFALPLSIAEVAGHLTTKSLMMICKALPWSG